MSDQLFLLSIIMAGLSIIDGLARRRKHGRKKKERPEREDRGAGSS